MTRYEDITAINWSALKRMMVSPLAYKDHEETPDEDTPAKLLGRATHCAVLEPEWFAERYVVPELLECAATTKKGDPCSHYALPFAEHCGVHGGQGEADTYRLNHPGVEVLTAEQGETVERCAAAVRAHHDAAEKLAGLQTEQVVTWTDPETGVACKGRLDGVARDRVVDLKTCRELARFPSDAASKAYHGQLAWYLDGARAAGVVDDDARAWLVVVETAPPYDVGALEVAGAELEAGRNLYRQLLAEWTSCRETGVWYGRYPTATRLELPRWAPGMQAEEI